MTRMTVLPEDPAAREQLVRNFFGSDFERTLTPDGIQQLLDETASLGPSLALSELLGTDSSQTDNQSS